ncbi:MAG: hypothetical protein CL610_27030 [Anaerolineaceae bacterium]|nr:hypothetical protein [Anaerolineaceae bacterium]
MLREIGLGTILLIVITAVVALGVISQTTEFGPLAGGIGVTDETALSWGQMTEATEEAEMTPEAEATEDAVMDSTPEATAEVVATEEPADEADATEEATAEETEEADDATPEVEATEEE